jgi:ATP-dependent DNA ligase
MAHGRPLGQLRAELNVASSRGDSAGMAMSIKGLPADFIFPAQPVLRLKPPGGTDWVHEIKHDGYRMIVRRDGPPVRLYSRNAYDWTRDWSRSRLLPS